MNLLFLGLGIFTLGLIAVALFLLLMGDGSREQKLMQYFLVGSLVQNAGYLLELTAPTVEAAIVATKMQYLGSLTIPISYCHFIFSYCYEKEPVKLLHAIKVTNLFALCLIYTCEWHHFYYRDIQWKHTADGHGYLNLVYGPGYQFLMVCGIILPYVLSMYALIRVCMKKPAYASDRKYKLILVLTCLPVVALFTYSTKLTYVYDPTPAVMGLALSIVAVLIWSRKVYDFKTLASEILLDSMGDGMLALDEYKRIANYNPAAAGIFPDLDSGSLGKNITELSGFPKEILDAAIQEDFQLNGRIYQGHVQQILDKLGNNKGYVVLILDITETKNYIKEIKRVQEQAEQANLAKSAFLANMSHEIRTPMNAIIGLSDIIMEESRGRKVYEYACDIKTASHNLLSLINDILDLSKVESGKMELIPTEYHLKTLVNDVLNMMDVVASQNGLMIKSEFDMSLPCRYLGDEGRIRQILINIVNNALKFTKEGYVRIAVKGGEPSGDPKTRWLRFFIEDSGCGIREEDLRKIFENFRQVDSKRNRSVEGTGLGLSITKRLVELMGGTIRVESVYGEGTTFIVEIPQKIVDERPLSEVPEEKTAKEEPLDPFVVDGYRVLVVDDNLINRKVAKGFLQSYGFIIDEAESGAKAIELVKNIFYDIIFMDHMMPVMDGIEAAQIIRRDCGENGRRSVIIALTANAMEGVKETFLSNGFQDFVTKPLERKALHETLLKWIPKEKRTAGTVQDAKSGENFQSFQIDGIDTDEVAIHYSGTAKDYTELLNLYCLDGERKLKVLQDLWEKRDYKTYGIEVHALKSASANVGAIHLSDNAREHEMAVKRGDESFVDAHVMQLLEEYKEQLEQIRIFLAKDTNSGQDAPKTDTLETGDLLLKLQDALDSLKNFRSRDCLEKLEDILHFLLPPDMENTLLEIQGQLKLYEDETAENMLEDLVGKLKSNTPQQATGHDLASF